MRVTSDWQGVGLQLVRGERLQGVLRRDALQDPIIRHLVDVVRVTLARTDDRCSLLRPPDDSTRIRSYVLYFLLMTDVAVEHKLTVWLVNDIPARMFYAGRRWQVSDIPTRIASRSGPPHCRTTQACTGGASRRQTTRVSPTFSTCTAASTNWHVHRTYS